MTGESVESVETKSPPQPRRGVVICVPTPGNVAVETLGAVAVAVAYLESIGVFVKLRTRVGGMSIDVARNIMLAEFLADPPEFTDLFFVDADVGGFSPHDVKRILDRPEEIIGGVYPLKQDSTKWPCSLVITPSGNYVNTEDQRLVAGELVPTGFMKISRAAAKKLHDREMLSENWYVWSDDNISITCANVFEFRVVKFRWIGEDRTMCDKWRELGGIVWIDPSINFTHRGEKVWSGNFGRWHNELPA